jgi:hypothetical protein
LQIKKQGEVVRLEMLCKASNLQNGNRNARGKKSLCLSNGRPVKGVAMFQSDQLSAGSN